MKPSKKHRDKEIKIDIEDVQLIMGDDFQRFERYLNNVFCGKCSKGTMSITIANYEIFLNALNDLVLRGTCNKCGGAVARYIETGESQDKSEVAKHIKMVKEKYGSVSSKNFLESKLKPKIVSGSRVMDYDDYMAMLEDGVKFEKSLAPLFDEFHKHLLGRGLSQKEAARYMNESQSFIGFCSIKFNIRNLDDVSRSMLTKHLAKMQRAIGSRGNTDEEKHILKFFFTFLHQKGMTNKKVLRAFYSALELKEMGIK
jgi:hypothetical protein